MNWMKICNSVLILWNKRICVWPQSANKPVQSDFRFRVPNYHPGAKMLWSRVGPGSSIRWATYTTPWQLYEPLLAGVQNCVKRDVCFCPVGSLFSTIKFASWCNFTACAVVTDSSQLCCDSRLSRWERHKPLITCRKFRLQSSSLNVYFHLVNGSKQIKISWPLEARAMPSGSIISNSCRVEMFLIKCHRRKENWENITNGLEHKIKYQPQSKQINVNLKDD